MKPSKKKRRVRASQKAEKEVNGDVRVEQNEEQRVVDWMAETFSMVSLDAVISAYKEADGDANKASDILGSLPGKQEDFPTSSSSGSVSGSSESFFGSDVQNPGRVRSCRGSKQKRAIASAGTISTVLGKDYVMSRPGVLSQKSQGSSKEPAFKEEVEQFLYSILGDTCELSMDVVMDVLCQCGYNVEKALDALLDLSDSSCKQFTSGECGTYNIMDKQDARSFIECEDRIVGMPWKFQSTDEASGATFHSLENEPVETLQSAGLNCRKYSEVLANSKAHSQSSSGITKSALPQKVLESLFKIPKSSEQEPSNLNWRNIVDKAESIGQRYNVCPTGITANQPNTAKGDEYQVFRQGAKQHWDSMRSYYQRAAAAYSRGERAYAAYLSEQGLFCNKMAREADGKASQEIFEARNNGIENVVTIDLHGQHVKQAMRVLKMHLVLLGNYIHSVKFLRVITGNGTHGNGKGILKQTVIRLLKKEQIEWWEENQGTVMIRLDRQRGEFNLLESGSDSE